MLTRKEKFKNEMYDYSNINEYYSYFGGVVYVSTSYYRDEDYFLILRTPKNMAVVVVPAALSAEFSNKKNRTTLLTDLDRLEASIHWIVPAAFHSYVQGLLSDPNLPDKNELIKLKNQDITLWNKQLVEDAIRTFKKDHTLLSKGLNFSQQNKAGYVATYTTAEGIYGTMYSIMFEWVTGNPFFDVKIKFFSQLKTRRLQVYDIHELATLLDGLVKRDDKLALAAIEEFTA